MQKFTRNTDDRAIGAAAVAALFAAVGAGMAAVMWEFDISATGATFIVLWLLIFLALSLGWRNELPPPGTKKAPSASDHSVTAAAAPSAPPPSAPAPSASAQASSSGTAPAAAAAPAPEPAPAPAAAAGTRPEALDAPRGGAADDLKQIKGVGPALEKLCNSLGFYHFDQIANWTADEVAWVDENLEGFKGRVSRDNWVEQARVLAAGGSTEFSDKVRKGEVY
jgi:predicted flap endonuclease-1-like 5' DNA nuclease